MEKTRERWRNARKRAKAGENARKPTKTREYGRKPRKRKKTCGNDIGARVAVPNNNNVVRNTLVDICYRSGISAEDFILNNTWSSLVSWVVASSGESTNYVTKWFSTLRESGSCLIRRSMITNP
nr:hypothetical protein [Tanacetum cinerariifolium]